MRRGSATLALFIVVCLSSFSVTDNSGSSTNGKTMCTGYTIVENGKGVNCNGDTVALQKIGGLQVLAHNIGAKRKSNERK